MKNKNVLISGAGIAGLTLAYWLKKYGFIPTIVEKHPILRTEGYKLDIRGIAVEVIKRMGLQPAIFKSRTEIQKALFVDSSGKIVTETSPDLCGVRAEGDLEIVRGDLCQILFNQIGDIEYLFDDSIKNTSQSEKGVHVEFEKNESRLFDIVVGADGLHSKVRKLGAYVLAGELAEAQGDYSKAFQRYEESLYEFVKKNQKLAKMSVALMEGSGPSWFTSVIIWLSHHLGRLMPGSLIQFFKNLGLRRTTKAANSLTLKDYQNYL